MHQLHGELSSILSFSMTVVEETVLLLIAKHDEDCCHSGSSGTDCDGQCIQFEWTSL